MDWITQELRVLKLAEPPVQLLVADLVAERLRETLGPELSVVRARTWDLVPYTWSVDVYRHRVRGGAGYWERPFAARLGPENVRCRLTVDDNLVLVRELAYEDPRLLEQLVELAELARSATGEGGRA